MKKTYIFLLLAIMALGAKAQILNGDLDGDNKLTKNDVNLLVKDVLTGNKRNMKSDVYNPFITDQMFISGCWWTDKYNYIEFKPSGINYEGKDYKYEYFPFLGHILLYDEYDYPVKAIYVMDKDAESITLRTSGSNVMTKYYRNKPVTKISKISVNPFALTFSLGGTMTLRVDILPEDADNQVLEWSSSNESVATVTQDGFVASVGVGTAVITAKATDGSGVTATCKIEVCTYMAGHEYVDLGLPSGTLWATMNVGEIDKGDRTDCGDYFAWAETSPKDNYTWDTYTQVEGGDSGSLIKYTGTKSIEAEDDAAVQLWGDPWRMPTKEEAQELLDNCNWEAFYDESGKCWGGTLTSKINGKSILLKYSGYMQDTEVQGRWNTGFYWLSTRDYTIYPNSLRFGGKKPQVRFDDMSCGLVIRPVFSADEK